MGAERATEAVAVETTVQEKAIAHPTEHGLLLAAIEQLGKQAKKAGLRLRHSYVRVARHAAMKTGRYLYAKQKKGARRQLKFLRMRLRRLIRDVRRKRERVPTLSERSVKRLASALGKAPTRSVATRVISIPFLARAGNGMHQQR